MDREKMDPDDPRHLDEMMADFGVKRNPEVFNPADIENSARKVAQAVDNQLLGIKADSLFGIPSNGIYQRLLDIGLTESQAEEVTVTIAKANAAGNPITVEQVIAMMNSQIAKDLRTRCEAIMETPLDENNVQIEDLGDIGPIHMPHVDLNKTPASALSPITRMALTAARIEVTASRSLPAISLRKKPGAGDRLRPAPNLVPPRSGQRIGRNDPCHCGSGKKFGKCCLPKLKNSVH